MERGSGCPLRLFWSIQGWRLVCDFILWHVPSKINIGSVCRVSVRIHALLGCTGSCGNM